MSDTFSVIPVPQDRARCKTCLDEGYIEVSGCTCTPGLAAILEHHEPMCGFMPCPEGCDAAPP